MSLLRFKIQEHNLVGKTYITILLHLAWELLEKIANQFQLF